MAGFGILKRLAQVLNPVPMARNGWRRILEAFPTAWQRNHEETHGDLLCYPTLYACVMRLTSDGGICPFQLKSETANGIPVVIQSPAYSPVLRKPNGFQTAQQFRESWLLSKLTQGNTYVLKRRDDRNVVIELYVLDPCKVQPMVSDAGNVYYQLMTDAINKLPEGYPSEQLLVPASEIIHDRCMTVHHPLIGVPPLCAAHWPALKNLKILKSSAQFFANSAQPGGILTAPAGMGEKDADAVKAYWAENFQGANSGKVAVIGADMKFTSFAMKGADSQLVEQMRYSDQQICQPFGIPPFVVGMGDIPAGLKADDVMNLYYRLGLQPHIEAMENLLDEGLAVPNGMGIWMDTEPLLRMDVSKQAEVVTKLIGGKTLTPDEGRQRLGYGPTAGGSTLWGQHQDYPLGVLAERNDLAPVVAAPTPAPDENLPAPADETRAIIEIFQRGLEDELGGFSRALEIADMTGGNAMGRVRAMAKQAA